MLQGEHSAILLTFLKLPFVIKIFVLSFYEWPFYTGSPVSMEKIIRLLGLAEQLILAEQTSHSSS